MGFRKTEEYINKLRLIVYGLLAVPLIIFTVVFLRSDKGENIQPLIAIEIINTATIVIMVAIIGLILYSYYAFTKKIKLIRTEQLLSKKLHNYYGLMIIRFTFLETAIFLSIAGLIATAQPIFIAAFVVMLFIFSVENPSIRKMIRHMRLNKEEKAQLLYNEEE